MKYVRTLFLVSSLALADAPVFAQDLQRGVNALSAGDYLMALGELRPLAERGNSTAQFYVGVMYQNGRGVRQNYAEAARWYRMAAEQGDTAAQTWLGIMYQSGIGIPQNFIEAAKWHRMAAEQGFAYAQNRLAIMYHVGQGLHQDYQTALLWFNISARNGDAGAAEMRDLVASNMTSAEVARVQRMAYECLASNYQICP